MISWNELRLVERYLTGKLSSPDRLLFEARLLTDQNLRSMSRLQKVIHEAVGWYGRNKLRHKLATIDQRLFKDPEYAPFREEIRGYFKFP